MPSFFEEGQANSLMLTPLVGVCVKMHSQFVCGASSTSIERGMTNVFPVFFRRRGAEASGGVRDDYYGLSPIRGPSSANNKREFRGPPAFWQGVLGGQRPPNIFAGVVLGCGVVW